MVVRAVLLAGVLFALAFTTYVVTGQRGWLGDKPREQLAALRQPYNPMHVALLARSEAAAAVRAIVDKPILGHGSWARNPGYQAWQEDFLESLTKPGVEITVANRESEKYGLFNGHSHLLQAWAYGGIVGAAFWVFQLYVFARLGLYFIARPWTPALPIVAIGIWLAYWNILFSPMAWGRTTWPALLAFLLILYATSTYQERQPAGVAATV
jgi:O-antigen ligase